MFLEINVLKIGNLYKYDIALLCTNWINLSKLTDIFPMFSHNYEIHNYEQEN